MRHKKNEIRTIDPTLSDDRLELVLHKLEVEHTKKLISELKKAKTCNNITGYKETLENVIKQLSESNRAKLAKYITHRKVIIELFEEGLNIKDENIRRKLIFII